MNKDSGENSLFSKWQERGDSEAKRFMSSFNSTVAGLAELNKPWGSHVLFVCFLLICNQYNQILFINCLNF